MRLAILAVTALSTLSLHAQLGPEHRFIYPAEASALAIRDLDGDGDGDVLRATAAGLLFQEQVAPDIYQVTRNLGNVDGLCFIHFADLDGDGQEDLLLPIRPSGVVRWAQALGVGDFTPIADLLSVTGEVFDARAADLDGDLDLDLIYVHDTADVKISWSENTGGMSYGPGQLIVATGIVPTPGYPRFDNFFDLGDVDLDGDMDMAIANSGLRWFENDGSGVFTAHILPATPTNVHIVLADIDGDGDGDMLLAGYGSDVYRTLNDGAGNFGPITSALYFGGSGLLGSALSMFDSEGDGDLDLYLWYHGDIAEAHQLLHCTNDGSGTFSLADILLGADNARPYAVGYADGDLIADVLGLANHGLELQLSGGGGTTRLNSVVGPLCLASTGSGVLVCSQSTWGPLSEGPPPLQLAGHGNLGGDLRQQPTEYWVSASGISRVDVAELNGMGGPEFLLEWRDPSTGIVRQNFLMSNGDSITSVGNSYYNMMSGPIVPCIRDVDMDGDNDVLRYSGGAINVSLNTGNGYFAPEQEYWVSSMYNPAGVTLCKVDADNYLDFVWCHGDITGPDSLLWNLNDGTGAPQSTAMVMVAPFQVAHVNVYINSPVVATHDIDQDGQEEVILFNGDSIAFMSAGNGTLSLIQAMPCPSIAYTLGDMDGDNYPDLVALLQNGDLAAWLNQGNGTMAGMLTLASAAQQTGRDHLILLDVSGDGALDVVTCATSGSAAWLENLFNSPYRAEGLVWHDVNADGVHDVGEGPLPFVLAQCDPPYGYPMTDTTGAYTFGLSPGNFVLSSLVPDTLWTLTSDSSQYHIAPTPLDPVSTGNDFGYAPAVIVTNLQPTLIGSMYMCNSYSSFFVQAGNLGTTNPDGHFALELDTAFSFYSAYPAPDSVVGQTVHWSFDELYYYSNYGAYITVEGPDVALLGLPVTNTLTLEAIIGGIVVQTTTALWTDTVTCSWDPNDKQVSPEGIGEHGAIDIATDHLDYTIRFQNTGTAPATDVVLLDVLDADLDPTSLTLLGYSHTPTQVLIRADGTLDFSFEGINLPDSGSDLQASQGFVKFRISLDNGLPHLTTIENTAYIYFDLNPPVVTNTTLNTLIDCSLHEAIVLPVAVDLLEATQGASYQWYLNGVEIPGGTAQTLIVSVNGDYTVQVTSIYGCVDVSDPYTFVNTTIMELGGFTMRIVPNPMSDLATVYFSEPLTAQHRIELVDVSGRVVRSLKSTGRTVLLQRDGLGAGMYMLRVQRADAVIAAQRMILR